MNDTDLGMAAEFRTAPEAVRRQAALMGAPVADLVGRLKRRAPRLVVTCARGSSAHAATFAKHLIERHLGLPVMEAAPNIATVYRQKLRLEGELFLTISQSGRSDDLLETAAMAKAAGALTASLVNDTESPLARASDVVLPMAAGPELSIAATKTFVASLAGLLRLTAAWNDDAALAAALERLPDRLARASDLDWSEALNVLGSTNSLVTIGRGPTLPIAREASLKFKETCDLFAEAFSGAEFLHGPVAIVSRLYPVVIFMPNDAAAAGLTELAADLRRKGAAVFAAEPGEAAQGRLPALAPDHPDADAVCLIQTFYGLIVRLAERRGTNIDHPRHLQKVTRTR
jgi:glucosamine--fructose-6-phosphate aminotransferase (isomerizing)